ncbi:hypothetical protein GF356_04805 [candidate division GN15 bacterium]|nr:hypothetical protein [candidate division GN15 bacterium]
MMICPDDIRSRVVGYLMQRFGMRESLWQDYEFYQSSRGRIHLGPCELPDRPKPDSVGCLIARLQRTVKPSSALFQLFGQYVQREILNLDRDQTQRYLAGESLVLATDQIADCRPGFVMLRYDVLPLACGLLREGGQLENQLPRASWCRVDLL